MYRNLGDISPEELHALITDAVEKGVLAALKGVSDSERPAERAGVVEPQLKCVADSGESSNAKAYLETLRGELDHCSSFTYLESKKLIERMIVLFDEKEIRYILANLLNDYTPIWELSFKNGVDNLIDAYRAYITNN